MGKRADQAKKRRKLQSGAVKQIYQAQPPTPRTHGSPSPPALIEPEELETAIYVLQTLAENPAELAQKSASLTSRISAALQDYRFSDALVLLFEMHVRRLTPKLGAIQRWVRECDATSAPDGSPGDPVAFRCLDMILRIANLSSGSASASASAGPSRLGGAESVISAQVRQTEVFRARESAEGEIAIWERMQNNTLFGSTPPPSPYPDFRAVHHVPGPERRPPNLYDSTVYASSPNAISLAAGPSRPRAPTRVDVPGVPGAFLVLDVFTPEECLQIVQAAEAIGFEKDQAAEGSALQKTSILARNFVWLADEAFHDHFYSQIRPFVPPTAPVSPDGHGGGKVRAINRRFRVYQYTENQLYRPHIDGAWPAAGLHPETGEYMHDSQPPNDSLWSRYTLLVYLNSDIPDDTGCTTFFLPSSEMGIMNATSVKPIQGAVLCFPHGDTEGSLLHEGSAVGPHGGKFVIRTDLLYEAQGFGQFKPPAGGVAEGGM
ncbi:hypothetical protein EHS25_006384 [Saitozyma podzolica]|uniref:Prolyl 4-hydroxylase alpha subunit domain-containing protein n=1 Tax=Saitozyma podzolica TaxID=1890683 RepID=A0A427YRT8_9TREE|nr:hypothetical protein EHS25_006384 [Saitozyma podzolica]